MSGKPPSSGLADLLLAPLRFLTGLWSGPAAPPPNPRSTNASPATPLAAAPPTLAPAASPEPAPQAATLSEPAPDVPAPDVPAAAPEPKPQPPAGPLTEPMIVAIGALSSQLTCHIAALGDRASDTGSLRSTGLGHGIQGFTFACDALPPGVLHYRARQPDGTWMEWTEAGTFAGTKGLGRNLSGFTVRLDDPKWRVRACGVFQLDGAPMEVGDGEDCVPPSAPHPSLLGMQIVILRA